jgi:hypothetical protein
MHAAMKYVVLRSSETSVLTTATRFNIPEDAILNNAGLKKLSEPDQWLFFFPNYHVSFQAGTQLYVKFSPFHISIRIIRHPN